MTRDVHFARYTPCENTVIISVWLLCLFLALSKMKKGELVVACKVLMSYAKREGETEIK